MEKAISIEFFFFNFYFRTDTVLPIRQKVIPGNYRAGLIYLSSFHPPNAAFNFSKNNSAAGENT